ncbi:MAG: hypothetical protein ACRC76_02190 [Proteocatella sp.]
MKKILLIVFILIVAIAGGITVNSTLNTKTKLIYEPLSEKERMLMEITGNNVIMYNLKNIPKGKQYEITMNYEVYENDKKIKDDMIFSLNSGQITTKKENENIGIGFEDKKIRVGAYSDGCYATSTYNREEYLNYNSTHFLKSVPLEPGDEIYLYYATTNDSIRSDMPLGVPIDSKTIDKFLEGGKSTILIKLSYKEV